MLKAFAAILMLSASLSLPAAPPPSSAVDAFVTAMENADADALAEIFADDATVFMPFESYPQRLSGKAAIRAVFEKVFDSVREPGTKPPYMKIEAHDLETQLIGDVAIVTFHLGKIPDADAKEPSRFSRRTFVLRRSGDRWLVQHLHASNLRL